jgi:hypothetical protein
VNVNNNIADNRFLVLHRIDKAQQELFSIMVWSIWKRKNNQVWDNITDSDQIVCERAMHLITSWRNAQNLRALANSVQQVPQQAEWRKPISGRYKCNIDESFSPAANKVGISMCIRDGQGRFVCARTECFEPILDVDVSEALGLLSALRWIDELQLRDMDIEMDCKRVVDGRYFQHVFTILS